jgi:hypothetical protein
MLPSGAHVNLDAANLQAGVKAGQVFPGWLGSTQSVSINPFLFKKGFTVQELQLAGACDWHKIQKLVQAETRLIHMLKKDGFKDSVMRLESMRDDLLSHRLAATAADDAKMFLRENCANDAYISKWRREIDTFDKALGKELRTIRVLPEHAIELRYQTQLLKHQARASLPFTGYYNPVSATPKVKPDAYKPHVHEPRFVYTPEPARPELLNILQAKTPVTAKLACFF